MQHGDAVLKNIDPQRPLSDAGRRDLMQLRTVLAKASMVPVRVLHSGKTRARQTAELLSSIASPEAVIEAAQGLGPNDAVEPWVNRVTAWVEPTALVGHLPFVGRLAARLVIGSADTDLVAFTPGTVLCVEQKIGGGWQIEWMLRPEVYRELGG